MASLLDELGALPDGFATAGIEYALCGGLSMAVHGFPRATMDINFLILPESLEAAYAAAARLGFDIKELDVSFKERAVEIRRVSKIDDDGEILPLDLLLVTPQVEDVWQSRLTIDFGGRTLCVVSCDGLIKIERLAGRPQDLADIAKLEGDES